MNNLMLCSSLYSDIDSLCSLISSMDYEDNFFGAEIKNFNFIPQDINNRFREFLNHPVEIQPDTGTFRKPNFIIHCEPFYQHCLWTSIVALEDTQITIWEQAKVKSFFDVPQENLEQFMINNCLDHHKWTSIHQLNMKKNDFIFIRPWMWYSMEKNKLIQVFLLNQQLNQEV